jgi:hypothetical protein
MRSTVLANRKFYKNTMAVIALLAGLAGAIAAVIKLIPKPVPVQNIHEITEFVLDRSEGMRQKFADGSRIQAAAGSVRAVLDSLADSDVLALRQFGGPCDGNNTSLAVKPGQNNRSKIQDALKSPKLGGQSSLARAVIEATGDFDESERFKGIVKSIVVVTGSRDACSPQGDAVAAIRDRMARIKNADIHLDFHFIGIGLDDAEREDVTKIADATGGKKPVFVDRREDLDGALQKVLVVEPIVRDTRSVITLLDAGVDHLNGVFGAIARSDYPAADKELKAAREEAAKSDLAWDEVGKGSRKQQFKQLYETAAESRRIRDDILNLAVKMLAQAKANDIEGYNSSRLDFNRLSGDYNRNGTSINALLKQM